MDKKNKEQIMIIKGNWKERERGAWVQARIVLVIVVIVVVVIVQLLLPHTKSITSNEAPFDPPRMKALAPLGWKSLWKAIASAASNLFEAFRCPSRPALQKCLQSIIINKSFYTALLLPLVTPTVNILPIFLPFPYTHVLSFTLTFIYSTPFPYMHTISFSSPDYHLLLPASPIPVSCASPNLLTRS